KGSALPQKAGEAPQIVFLPEDEPEDEEILMDLATQEMKDRLLKNAEEKKRLTERANRLMNRGFLGRVFNMDPDK
ncbi:MAG TPA: hypothetical protein VJA22_01940, partial [Patescibacteria group bacterium]|nr:hypothetical protein [Patescibacteria group bacterium]